MNKGRDVKGTLLNSLKYVRNNTSIDASKAWERACAYIRGMEDGLVNPTDKNNMMNSLIILRYDLSMSELSSGSEEDVLVIRRTLRRVKRVIKMIGKSPVYGDILFSPIGRPTTDNPGIELVTEVLCKLIDIPESTELSIPLHHTLLRELRMSEYPQESTLWRIISEDQMLRLEISEVWDRMNPIH